MAKKTKPRNEHAAALHIRAGNAGTAIAVDTRPKSIPDRRKQSDRKAIRAQLKTRDWD